MTLKRGTYATPKQKDTVVVTVRMSKELHATLCDISKENNLSLNRICLHGIIKLIDETERG